MESEKNYRRFKLRKGSFCWIVEAGSTVKTEVGTIIDAIEYSAYDKLEEDLRYYKNEFENAVERAEYKKELLEENQEHNRYITELLEEDLRYYKNEFENAVERAEYKKELLKENQEHNRYITELLEENALLREKIDIAAEALDKIGTGMEWSECRNFAYEALMKIKGEK